MQRCLNDISFQFLRLKFLVVFIGLLLLSSTIIFGQVAPVSPPTTGFAIDGGLRANTPTSPSPFAANQGDWYPGVGGTGTSVFDENGAPISPSTSQTSGRANPTDPFNGGDDVFSQGSKFNDYISALRWTTNSAPDKNDINNALYHIARDPGNNNQWAFMAGDRLSTNGTSYIDFEFLQGTVAKNLDGTGTFNSTPAAGKNFGGGRTENDMLISMEYTNGGTKPVVYVYQWKLSGNTWSYQLATITNLSNNAYAETNRSGNETDLPYTAFGNDFYQQYAFVEAAVNITFLLEQTGLACAGLSIKTLWVKTKAAATSTAALKDFVEPIPVNLNFGSSTVDARGPYCVSDNTAHSLSATPSSGTFSGTGVTLVAGTYYFTPSAAGVGTHRINYSASGCSAYTDIIVNALPTLGGPASVCVGSTINLTPSSGGTWSSSDETKATITNAGLVTGVAAGSVTFTFTDDNSCSSTKNVTVNSQPLAPTLIIVNPSLCGTSTTGSISVCSPNSNYTYSISVNGDAFGNSQSGATISFTGLSAGSDPVVKVSNGTTGCVATQSCSNALATCPNPANATRMRTESYQTAEQQIVVEEPTKITAYPNPFSDRIKFVITSSITGKGSLDVYNMLGQKVKTVYQGLIVAGSQTFQLNIPRQKLSNLIYVLRIGDKKISGKLLQLKN